MNRYKRFCAVLLVIALTLALSVSAYASSGFNAGITVTKESNKITVVINDSEVLHEKQPTLSIPADESFQNAVVLIDATAVSANHAEGMVSFKVAKGGTYYIVTDAVLTESVAATCVASGKNIYLYNDTEYAEIVAATGEHSFGVKASESKATDATCTEAANYYVECDNCDAVSDEKTVPVGEANGHDFSDTGSRRCANCTEANPNYIRPSRPSTPSQPSDPSTPPSTPEEPKVETEKVENEDGSVTESTTTTEKTENDDGSVSETVTVVEQTAHKDGTTVNSKSTTTTVTDAEGNAESLTKTVVEVELSDKAVSASNTVALPIEAVEVSETSVTTVSVALPNATETVKVEIPVAEVSVTNAIVLVHEDGTEEIVQKVALTEDGLAFTVSENVTVKVVDNTKEFDDVKENDWYSTSVSFATARGIIIGMGNDNFSPNTNMTRGQLAQMLYNLESKPESIISGTFTDTNGAWYSEAVEWAFSAGLVEGLGNGNFGGNQEMTREQLITLLYRYAGNPTCEASTNKFPDSDSVSSWAQDAMDWAVSIGLVNGMGGKINPQGIATRAQAAEVLMRFINTVL